MLFALGQESPQAGKMLIVGWAPRAFWPVYNKRGDDVDFWVGLPSVLASLQNKRDVEFGVGSPSVLASLQQERGRC